MPSSSAGQRRPGRQNTVTAPAPAPRRGGGGSFPTPAPRPVPARPAPPVPVFRAPAPRGGGGSNFGNFSPSPIGGGGGGGGYAAPVAPPAPPKPTQDEYLAGDAGFKAQQAALQKALADFEANNTAELTQYNTNYGKAIDNLGYRPAVLDDPKTLDINEAQPAGWNLTDNTKASGRAYQNQLNDFAGRGTLQSTLYTKALDDLMRSLNDQRTSIDTAKNDFTADKGRALASYKNENTSSLEMARADAIARYAAMYGAL